MTASSRLIKLNLCLIIFLSTKLFPGIDDYIYLNDLYPSYSNSGTVGLINMPNARLMPAGSLAFSWSDADPYQRGSIIGTPFDWFEASYQYTDVNNALYSLTPSFSGDQTYKDKSFDAKFLLLKETNYLPALAVGVRDMAGTGVFSSEYVVASKRYNNIDLTLGLGWGAYSDHGKKNPLTKIDDQFEIRDVSNNSTQGGEFNLGYFFSGKVGVFGGAEIILPNLNGTRVKIEYDSTDYELEGFPYGEKSFNFAFEEVRQPSSKINIGVVYPVFETLHLKLNYIKGNTVSFGFAFNANFGPKDPIVIKRDSPKKIKNPPAYKALTAESNKNLYRVSLMELNPRGFPLQDAEVDGDTYKIVYSQSRHRSWARSTGRILRVLDDIAPESIKNFEIANINGGLGTYKLQIPRDDFSNNKQDELYKVATRNVKLSEYSYDPGEYEFSPRAKLPAIFQSIEPSFRTQFGGPDGFFFGNLRLDYKAEILFKKSLSLKAAISQGIANNFGELKLASDSVLPHVRTDIVKYLKQGDGLTINHIQLDQFIKPTKSIYLKASAGLFEQMFGGIGGEVLYRPFNSDWAIGAEAWKVKQRAYDQMFDFLEYETLTGHINLYYKEPRTQVLIMLKGGRFLAEDSGIHFDFSRRFKSGTRMGIFFAQTDISEFEFGEGSFDKGFYFFIPIETFFGNYSKGSTGFGLRPLTRDGAAFLRHRNTLYGVTDQAQSHTIYRDWDDLYD